ncbi:MAG TPA: hypothetical protein PLP18_06185 [Smithellaceae bacterium]|nr:hypothetical protein [Smithellaceae bacterium]
MDTLNTIALGIDRVMLSPANRPHMFTDLTFVEEDYSLLSNDLH